jgi:RNA polymerase sigma-70 factor (ECF subfamily)
MPEAQDQEARFNRLYERHFDAVRAYAWRRAPGLADEIVAETFLVAWRRLPDVPDDALPWLIGVARNVRANLHRSDRRRDALVESLGPETPTAEDPLASVGERDALRGALAGLLEADREVLLLTAWDDLDRDQVARALGCSRANVAVRLFRARRRLAALLTGDEAGAANDRPLHGSVSHAGS